LVVLFIAIANDTPYEFVYALNAAIVLISFLSAIFLKSGEEKSREENTESEKTSLAKAQLKTYFTELKEGLLFSIRGVMLPLVIAVVSMSFFADIAYVNMPMLVEEYFGAVTGFILLSGLSVFGGLIGTIVFGAIGEKIKLGKILITSFVFAGVVRILFVTFIDSHLIGAVLIFVVYTGITGIIAMFYHILVQKLPQKNLIGRVDTSITSLRAVAAALGSLAGGVLGTILAEANMAFIVHGISYITIGLFLFLSKRVRTLPEISSLGCHSEHCCES